MATKRPAPDTSHNSRGQHAAKRQKPSGTSGRSFKKAHTVNEVKSRLRSLKRLLENKEDLPADVRVEKERALQTAEHELAETERAKRRSDMIAAWHKVRFFERQKATRRLKQARKSLRAAVEADEAEEVRERLGKDVDEFEIDLNYALYFPLDVAYVPLFPNRKKRRRQEEGETESENDDDQMKDTGMQREGDEKMRAMVRQSMADGTLDALRNGKFTESSKNGTSRDRSQVSSKQRIQQAAARRKPGDGKTLDEGGFEEDESGGAFFE